MESKKFRFYYQKIIASLDTLEISPDKFPNNAQYKKWHSNSFSICIWPSLQLL